MLNYLILFLLPTYLIRLSLSNSVSVNFLEILLIIAIVLNFYKILKTIPLSKIKNFFYFNKKSFLPFILIITGFAISYLTNQSLAHWQNWSDGLGKLMDIIFLPILYTLSLVVLIKFKQISFNKLLNIYFLSSLIISLLGLFYFLNSRTTFDHRLALFFQSPNQLAIFVAPAILVNLSILIRILRATAHLFKSKILFYFLSLLLLVFNIWQTFSLGAWLALLFTIILLLLHYDIINNIIMLKNIFSLNIFSKLLFFTTILMICFIVNADIVLSFLSYHPQVPANSYDSRLAIYQVEQKIISHDWLIGIGPGNFQNVYLDYQKYFPPYPQWAVPHSHNNLMHFWIEGGLLAGIGFLLLLYRLLLSRKIIFNKNTLLPLSIFSYFIIHGLVDTTIWTPSSAIIFFFIAIYIINYRI